MDYTLKYIIVEDDDFDRLSVETEADKFPFFKRIASCSHGLEAMELIATNYIVHTGKITAVKSNKVFLANSELPVGKLYKNVLKRLLLTVFLGFWVLLTPAQKPQTPQTPPEALDLAKRVTYKDTMTAWVGWCESLRINASSHFLQLQSAGKKGLQMIKPEDDFHKAQFDLFTALGYYYQSKFDSAEYYFYQSLYAAQRAHDTRQIDRACVALIPVTFQLQQMNKVDSIKNIMQSIVDTTHDRDLLKDGYFALGSYYQYKSYYSTAQDYFIKSIELREQEVDTTKEAKKQFDFAIQCDLLSKLYLNAGMADKSIAALRRGERFAAVSPNVANRLSSSFVEAYTTSGQIDSALYYDKKLAAAVGNPLLFPSEIISSDLNIAIYYLDHKQYGQALPYLSKADSLAAKIGSPLLNFQVQMTWGRYLAAVGKYQAAIAEIELSMPVAMQLDKELYGNDLKYMALAQEGAGNTAAALAYYKQYTDVTDSLNKEKISRTFADLETRYQTHEKELQITSLDKENRLHVLELENASHTKLLLVLGLVALGIISLLLYFIYRNKEKLSRVLGERNQQLDDLNRDLEEANETKARLFGIIGHDLRGPVAKIVRLLQLQKERPELFSETERQKHEERLKKASETALETMEDLLLWSKSQMQHFVPDLHPVRVADVLEKEMLLLQEQLDDHGVAVENRVPESHVWVTDENFLSVIVRNLVQNAVRHSDGNKLVVIGGGAGELSITNPSSTADAAEMNKKLSHTRVGSGTSGLGLQIANELAGKLGARLFFLGADGVSLTAVLSWG